MYHVGWRVTSGRSQDDRIARDRGGSLVDPVVHLTAFPHELWTRINPFIPPHVAPFLSSNRHDRRLFLPSFPPGTSHPRFWRWLTVTTLAKRPSAIVNVLSRSLFPAGRTSAARAQLQFTDPLLRSYLLSENLCLLLFSAAANFSSFPLISSFLIFFLSTVFSLDHHGGQRFPFF